MDVKIKVKLEMDLETGEGSDRVERHSARTTINKLKNLEFQRSCRNSFVFAKEMKTYVVSIPNGIAIKFHQIYKMLWTFCITL